MTDMITQNATEHDRPVKCLIWDLDGTIWEGSLLENGVVTPKPGIVETIQALDERGILQSVASKNDYETAWPVLESLNLSQYFLHPQISWSSKVDSVLAISEKLGIGIDSMAFIDDRIEERDEVKYFLPQVTVIEAGHAANLLEMACLQPRVVTNDGHERRKMYQADIERSEAESRFIGSRETFLQTLGMRMSIAPALEHDLARAEELTLRANQLNTTGRTYSLAELDAFARSPEHLLLIAKLDDCYGSYGTVGLALVEKKSNVWTIGLLIMSCRVMTRGVGGILLGCLLRLASRAKVKLRADFVDTGRNRQMFMTYKFSGFRSITGDSETTALEHDLQRIHPYPSYIMLNCRI